MTRKPKRIRSLTSALKIARGNRVAVIWTIISGFILIVLLSQFIPVSFNRNEVVDVPFKVSYKDEAAIELGEEKIVTDGKKGSREVEYKYTRSLFQYFFGGTEAKKEAIGVTTKQEAVDQVVLRGTRKWQYMMCSNGSYRYYTDEQFKDSRTGFTNKSPDECAKNNQGNKISLADSPSGGVNRVRPAYTPPNCRVIDIPYGVVYKEASWLNVGESQSSFGGVNGWQYICSDGSSGYTISPIDKIVYRGTRQNAASPYVPATPTRDYAAKDRCDSDYSRARSQIINGGAADSSAMQYLQQIYTQCLSRAGF